jgi:hypothetical protein
VQVKAPKKPELAPLMKQELKKRFPEFDEDPSKPAEGGGLDGFVDPKLTPGGYLKHMDTSFESFFYQRDYSMKNFNFYL